MENILVDKIGDNFGRIGASACFNYSDGSVAKVGDIVGLYLNGEFRSNRYVVQDGTMPFVMGIKDIYIKNGIGESPNNDWSIRKITDASEIEDGMSDGNGIVAQVKSKYLKIHDEESDWLVFISTNGMGGHFSKEKVIEIIKNDFTNGVLLLDERLFSSAKLVNKKSGQVIDLLK